MKLKESQPAPNRHLLCLLCLTAVAQPAISQEQSLPLGTTSEGNTGGLVIPSAEVLKPGDVALRAGNDQEPRLGNYALHSTYSAGFGVLPHLEVFGRVAAYQNARTIGNGVMDLSANFKLQLTPDNWKLPKLAIGMNDVGGGAKHFSSKYLVMSDQVGSLRWTLGYARASNKGAGLNRAFGGAEWFVGHTGFSTLAEYDGNAKHLGLRYYSEPIAALADGQFVGSVQRSFGASNPNGRAADASSVSLALRIPFGEVEKRRATAQPANALPPLDEYQRVPNVPPRTREDSAEVIQRALAKAGLERVRVGSSGDDLVVEYENHLYGRNEVDAIGIAFGVAAELAPRRADRMYVRTLKAGQLVYENAMGIPEYREYLRSGDISRVRGSLATTRQATLKEEDIQWHAGLPTRHAPVRFEVKPSLNYAVATELGLIDYALAANVQAIAPLWKGAELYANYIQPVSHSSHMDAGQVFHSQLQQRGINGVSLQQSFWWRDRVFTNLGLGKFDYSRLGAQLESLAYLSNNDNTFRLKLAAYANQAGKPGQQNFVGAATYRWVYSPNTWLEGGEEKFSDGTHGPTVALTRWYGDVAMQLFYRRGGHNQFVGLSFSMPLTPRKGFDAGAFQLMGPAQYGFNVRTRVVNASSSANSVLPSAVRELELAYDAELAKLNAGRQSQNYFFTQMGRMRESFYLYARNAIE